MRIARCPARFRCPRLGWALVLVAVPVGVHAVNQTLVDGTELDLSALAGDDGGPDGARDFSISAPGFICPEATHFAHSNQSARATAPGSWYEDMDYGEAVVQDYGTSDSFCPAPGDLYYVQTSGVDPVLHHDNRFYKLRINSSTGAGANVDYEYLGTGIPSPPESSFGITTYDLFAMFTDTSVGQSSSWAWSFGDGGVSAERHPRHRYLTAGNRTVTLAAGDGSGADPTPAAHSVTVAERPSISAAPGGTFDLDADAIADLQLEGGAGEFCGSLPHSLFPRNGAGVAYLLKDFRDIVDDDLAGVHFSEHAGICPEADFLQSFLVRTGEGETYKAWAAAHDGSGMRLEVALLRTGPPRPETAFTYSTYDLFVHFQDTSTGAPTSWEWTFGDGQGSGEANPRHRFSSPNIYESCLEASNINRGTYACQFIEVAQLPFPSSVSLWPGDTYDINGDFIPDLMVQGAGSSCDVAYSLVTLERASYAKLSKDYRSLVPGDAFDAKFSSGSFCVEVDYLNPFLLRAATGDTYRIWTAGNGDGVVRLIRELLVIMPSIVFSDGFE